MSDLDTHTAPQPELLRALWAEARDLVRQLEGTTVQRLAVTAGDCRIEIERAAPPAHAAGAPPAHAEALHFNGPVAAGAGPGPGVDPGARGASGVFAAIVEADHRSPVLAPLVGTFYAAAKPGAKPFVTVGDVVEPGQTVCIVEAMKMMNEVAAGEPGRVAEIVAENGEPVEFDQVLMYLEPAGGE